MHGDVPQMWLGFIFLTTGQETVIKLVDREILMKEREEKLRVRDLNALVYCISV